MLLHNSGICNCCTIKRSITLLCIPKHSTWQNGGSIIVAFIKLLFQPHRVICHAWSCINIILSKSLFFFQTEQNHVVFHRIPDFSYSCCVKKVFCSVLVLKCTDMCKHRFGVQLLQNPLLCSSTENATNRRQSKISALCSWVNRDLC
jgi:hypothetical protein